MKTLQRTLTIVKPDAVAKNAVGDIIEQFEKQGFRILAMKMLEISKHQAEQFYAVHARCRSRLAHRHKQPFSIRRPRDSPCDEGSPLTKTGDPS